MLRRAALRAGDHRRPWGFLRRERMIELQSSYHANSKTIGDVRPEEAAFGTKFFHHMALVLVQDLFGKNVEVAEGPQELQPFRE